MQKKKKENKVLKSNQEVKELQQEIEEKGKQKSILKPFAFFALFVSCVGIGTLYPYLNETESFPLPQRIAPPLMLPKKIEAEVVNAHEAEQIQKIVQTPVLSDIQESNNSKDKLILSQTKTIEELNERLHRLEIENLNLREKSAHQEKLTPLTVHLMEEIYTGQPFATTLNLLLMYDKTNAFALAVQEKLSAYASTGLPTAQDLKQMFLSQMEMAKDAYYINHRNTSWNQRWTAYFKSLVHIYPEQMNPDETQGIDLLFLAKNQVLKGQFEQALKSVEKLPDTSRQFLNNFIKNTHRYLDGKQIIDAYLRK